MDPPDPPESLPKYLTEGLPKQDQETLRDTLSYVEALIEHRAAVSADDVVVDPDERIESVEETSIGARVVKYVPCGKDCGGCPHGPYEYRVNREGEDVVWDYVGPVEE